MADGADPTRSPYLDQPLPEGSGPRAIVVGAVPDSRWRAVWTDPATQVVTGLPAVTVEGASGWSQAFLAPEGSPQVVVEFDHSNRSRWLWIQLAVLIVLIILALPARKRTDFDTEDAVGSGSIAAGNMATVNASGTGASSSAFIVAGPSGGDQARQSKPDVSLEPESSAGPPVAPQGEETT